MRQTLKSGPALLRNYGATNCEIDFNVALGGIIRKVVEALRGVRDFLLIAFDWFWLTAICCLLAAACA